MADVFISYAQEDRGAAGKLAAELEQLGLNIWWDIEILGGRRFRQAIEEEIDSCRCFIVIWSKHSSISEFVEDEVDEARLKGKPIVPLSLHGAQGPIGLRGRHTIDFTNWVDGSDGRAFRQIVESIRSAGVSWKTLSAIGNTGDRIPKGTAPRESEPSPYVSLAEGIRRRQEAAERGVEVAQLPTPPGEPVIVEQIEYKGYMIDKLSNGTVDVHTVEGPIQFESLETFARELELERLFADGNTEGRIPKGTAPPESEPSPYASFAEKLRRRREAAEQAGEVAQLPTPPGEPVIVEQIEYKGYMIDKLSNGRVDVHTAEGPMQFEDLETFARELELSLG